MNNKKIITISIVIVAVLLLVFVVLTALNGDEIDKYYQSEEIQTQTQNEKEEKEQSDDKVQEGKARAVDGEVKNQEKNEEKKSDSSTSTDTEEKVYKPTFMYFVSKKDAQYETAMASVEKLKGEYSGKVNFDIVDIDENPEAAENFPVKGQTPFLIMLDESNNICAFVPTVADYEQLKEYVDGAFTK